MALHYIEHYGFVDDGHSLAHYGVPGMRWRRHRYTGSSSADYDYSRRDQLGSTRGDSDRARRYSEEGRARANSSRARQTLWTAANREKIDFANMRNTLRARNIGRTAGDANRAAYYQKKGRKPYVDTYRAANSRTSGDADRAHYYRHVESERARRAAANAQDWSHRNQEAIDRANDNARRRTRRKQPTGNRFGRYSG